MEPPAREIGGRVDEMAANSRYSASSYLVLNGEVHSREFLTTGQLLQTRVLPRPARWAAGIQARSDRRHQPRLSAEANN